MSSGPFLYSKAGLLGLKLYFGIFESVSRIAYIWWLEDTSETKPPPSQKRFPPCKLILEKNMKSDTLGVALKLHGLICVRLL